MGLSRAREEVTRWKVVVSATVGGGRSRFLPKVTGQKR